MLNHRCSVLFAAASLAGFAAIVGCRPAVLHRANVGPSADAQTFVGVEAPPTTLPAASPQGSTPVAVAKPILPASPNDLPPAPGALPAPARVTVNYTAPEPLPVSERPDQDLAAEALARIGPPAVPALVEALNHPDASVRREAVEVLARMGPDAKDAAPALTKLLDDENEVVRKLAAKALANIGPDAAVAVPALMRNLLQAPPAIPNR